jgi:hypothetical protein
MNAVSARTDGPSLLELCCRSLEKCLAEPLIQKRAHTAKEPTHHSGLGCPQVVFKKPTGTQLLMGRVEVIAQDERLTGSSGCLSTTSMRILTPPASLMASLFAALSAARFWRVASAVTADVFSGLEETCTVTAFSVSHGPY